MDAYQAQLAGMNAAMDAVLGTGNHSEPKRFTLDTRRLSDPAYLADCLDAGAERQMGHEVAAAFRRSVANVLRSVADQADREHMIGVIEEGIFNAHDLDTTDRDLAAGAYDELVREGLIIGAAGDA